jgi:NifU-like protein involved in Fe-S cluster formation
VIAAAEHSAPTLGRFRSAVHQGRLQGPGVVSGRAGSLRQGRAVALDLRLAGDTVVEARFRAYGCPATIAVADLVCERSAGRPIDEVAALPAAGLEAELELLPARRGCILVVQDALRAALELRESVPMDTSGT